MPADAPLLPYENLGETSVAEAPARADELLVQGWRASGAYPALKLGDPIPWDDASQELRTWVFRMHCLDMVQDLLLAHASSGEARYLAPALQVAIEWITRHPSLDDASAAGFAWYDMAVGLRAQRLAYIADAAEREGLADAGQLARLHASLELHRQHLQDDANIAFHSNHGFYQVAGQIAMARRFRGRLPGMDEAFAQGQQRLQRIIEVQFTAEGVHREHSPDYHRMVYESLSGLVKAGLCESDEVVRSLDRIEAALAWFVYPNGILVNFGDSDSRDMTSSSRDALRRWRCPQMQFVASEGRVGAAPVAQLERFAESGYAVARPDWQAEPDRHGYLALSAAFHSRTHKHADDLSFVWFDRGAEILVDAGRYGYLGRTEQGSPEWEEGFWYSDPRRMYVESTRAHNVVQVDGRDFPRRKAKPYGSQIERAVQDPSGIYFMEAETRHFGSVRHARSLLWLPGDWLLVYDWLQDGSGQAHDFRQWWHLAPSFEAELRGTDIDGFSPLLATPLRVVSLVGDAVLEAPVLGDEETLQGHYSHRERSFMPNYSFAATRHGVSAVFLTLASFGGPVDSEGRQVDVAPSGRSLRARWSADETAHDIKLSRLADQPVAITYGTRKLRQG